MSLVGQLLGDSLVGSCFRAVEQACTPGVEVRVYVRNQAEAALVVELVVSMAGSRRLVSLAAADPVAIRKLADELDALTALELNNGSVIAFKREVQAQTRDRE